VSLKPTYVFFSNNGSFTDYSLVLNDWQRGTATLDYTTAQDYIYIGRYKPFSKLYFDLSTPNTATETLTLEYYDDDDSAWTELTPDLDDTVGMTRSGWLKWTIPSTWGDVAVNSETLYWVRLSYDASFSPAAVFNAVGLILCDDYDLKKKVPNISDYVPSGYTTHVLAEIAAMDEIVQRFRAEGKYKVSASTGIATDVDEWDLHRIEQINQAATFKALELIFRRESNATDDSFWQKAEHFAGEYEKAYGSALLSMDADDSGFEGVDEQVLEGFSNFVRVRRY